MNAVPSPLLAARDRRPHTAVRLVHITTVPMTLAFFRGQVSFMAGQGLDVHVVSSPGPELEAFRALEPARTWPVAMTRELTPARDLVALLRLIRLVRRLRPDIVHAHTPKAGLLGMLASAVARVPVRIYHLRGLPLMTTGGALRFILRAAEKVSCALAHEVLCVSDSLRDFVVAEKVVRPDKIQVLAGGSSNGVDARGRFDPGTVRASMRAATRARLGLDPDANLIGFVGRLVADKGIEELASAWQLVRVEWPGARLVLVGPTEQRDALSKATLMALRDDDRVRMTGQVSDPAPYYAAMDLLVLPSYREGLPNVALEAAAMELPVITTDVVGCVDAIVPEETGILVGVRDPLALAHAIGRYLRDPDLRRRHGTMGRLRCLREFEPSRIWSAIYGQYMELLDQHL